MAKNKKPKDIFNTAKNIIHITDSDLDGVGCAIVSTCVYGNRNEEIDLTFKYANHENKEQMICNVNLENCDLLIISDLSITKETAEYLNDLYKNGQAILYVDHHVSSLHARDYEWAIIKTTEYIDCGTTIILEALTEKVNNWRSDVKKGDSALIDFVHCVRLYDTFAWTKDRYSTSSKKACDLNTLLSLYIKDLDSFREKIRDKIYYDSGYTLRFTKEEREKVQILNKLNIDYIQSRTKTIRKVSLTIDNKEYKVGVIFADRLQSNIGEFLRYKRQKKKHENDDLDVDFLFIVNGMNHVSLRSYNEKDDIDLSKIAEYFGGGGNPKTAGCSVNRKFFNQVLSQCIKE